MAKINELNISINKALIDDVRVSLKNDQVVVVISGSLLTKEGKRVSSFTYGSDWYGDAKFDVPAEILAPVRELFERLTPVIYEKINGQYSYLEDGKKKKPGTVLLKCTCTPRCAYNENDCNKCDECIKNQIPF